MKKGFFIATLLCVFTIIQAIAQTPSSRAYFTNIAIPGNTDDGASVNYLLLHRAVNNDFIDPYSVFGKVSAVRGGTASWNRKWTVEVNTASAYNANRGSLIAYNEYARLVTVFRNGIRYMAVEIRSNSALFSFSFTGWVESPTLELVTGPEVTNVEPFREYDMVAVPGGMVLDETGDKQTAEHLKNDAFIVNTTKGGALSITAPTFKQEIFSGHQITCFSPNFTGGLGIAIGKNNSGYIQAFSNTSEDGTLYLNPNGGDVGIGVHDTKGFKLAVAGNLIAEKIVVKNRQNWPDFVFSPDYSLMSLQETAAYISAHHHLPGMPSAEEVKEKGVDLEEMNAKLLQKLEEMTLHLIRLDEENKALKAAVEKLNKK